MPTLTALVLNCSLKASPATSSTDKLAGELLEALADHGVTGETVRVVDHDVKPGVEADMGDGDAWPAIRAKLDAADILVVATPTWMGQHSSVAQRVYERLDSLLSETDDQGRTPAYGKVGVAVVVGNEDGAHHISAVAFQCLSDVGFTIPPGGVTYWNGEAMNTKDYTDLTEPAEPTESATRSAAANAAHLATLLRANPFPGV